MSKVQFKDALRSLFNKEPLLLFASQEDIFKRITQIHPDQDWIFEKKRPDISIVKGEILEAREILDFEDFAEWLGYTFDNRFLRSRLLDRGFMSSRSEKVDLTFLKEEAFKWLIKKFLSLI